MREWLRAEGYAALFVDFDPVEGISAGRDWERELYVQLRKADGLIFIASAESIASSWCFAEVSLARALGKPVFPVRIEPGVGLALLEHVQWVDLADPRDAFSELRAGLRLAGLNSDTSFEWDPLRSPYPGLRPFEAEDAAVFFGRDEDITRLLDLLHPILNRGDGRFVAVVGPSGSGKSSLMRAGLMPRLSRMKTHWVLIPPMRPGKDPTRNLARSIGQAFAVTGESDHSIPELHACLTRGPEALTNVVVQLAERDFTTGSVRPRVLLMIDQAEELLTLCGPQEQKEFLRLLVGAVRTEDSPLWLLATVRSEYLSTAPDRAGLAESIDGSLVVEPMSRMRLPEVIAKPAQRGGLEFEAGLIERMVEETAGGDALPMLAYTLSELYERAGRDGRVAVDDYEAVGGVVGALQRRADRLIDELTSRGRGPLIMPTLLKLATVEGEGEPTRRKVERRTLRAEEKEIVDAFIEARLLTSSQSPSSPRASRGASTIEVAHEALLRQWPPLREAIEAARDWLRRRSELERLTADWDRGCRHESFLLRGEHLARFGQFRGGRIADIGPVESEFLVASRALEARELELARRSDRRLRL